MQQENAKLKALLLKIQEAIARFSEENEVTNKTADLQHNNNRDSNI